MHKGILQQLSISVMALAVTVFGVVYPAFSASTPEQLVSMAEDTFSNFRSDPDMKWIRNNIGNAKAVIIVPEVRKVGLVAGASGGRAVMLARDPDTGKFSGPAFYSIRSASLGLQAGIEKAEVVMLVMNDRAVNSLLSSQLKLGGDVSISLGPVGEGAEKSITTDVVAFGRSKGIYGGLNLNGTLVTVNHDWNKQYYGKTVTPTDILVRHSVTNPRSDRLLEKMAQTSLK
jgi:lipid-binding SYLF domain-containing protein